MNRRRFLQWAAIALLAGFMEVEAPTYDDRSAALERELRLHEWKARREMEMFVYDLVWGRITAPTTTVLCP